MSLIYAKVQTNRHKLKEYIKFFDKNKIKDEVLYAPRPLPNSIQNIYYALVVLSEDSINHKRSIKFSNFNKISKNDWESTLSNIKYFWSA